MLPAVLKHLRERRLRSAVIITVGVIAALGLADFLTSVHQLSGYDGGWNDLSRFRGALDAAGYNASSIISTPALLNVSEGFYAYEKILVIIGVERPYLAQEVDTIVDFVNRGGFLLIADDFGYGNGVVGRLGMSFYGRKLFSSDFERNPAFVRINATVDSVDYTVLLDSPTALERVAPGWERAWTSDDTWVDENGNGERDIDEASASQPVVALWSSAGAEGRVIAVSDPGLFINDMWGREDNAAFVLNMLRAWFPGAHEVMFDETRHKPETVREGAWRTALAVGVLALGNIYGKAMLGLMALLAVGTGIMAVKPPADWRHEDTLGELSFHHLARTSFRSEDRERLRAALLEKARISMCMYPDEFERLSQDELRSIIRDDDLLRLVEEPGRVRLEELEQLTVEVRNWGRG
jgi:hypothetical protein